MRFYKTVGRAITNTTIQWDPIIKYFKQEWEILVMRKGEDVSDVPMISKPLPIIKWTEYFADFLHQDFGERNIPLSYVIRELDTVPIMAPLTMRGKLYSDKHGSVEKEIITRASHTHNNFKEDNSKVYSYIEE